MYLFVINNLSRTFSEIPVLHPEKSLCSSVIEEMQHHNKKLFRNLIEKVAEWLKVLIWNISFITNKRGFKSLFFQMSLQKIIHIIIKHFAIRLFFLSLQIRNSVEEQLPYKLKVIGSNPIESTKGLGGYSQEVRPWFVDP